MTAEWLDEAACLGYNTELWFPHDKNQHADWETPRAICRTCPVAALCLKSANEKREDYGMFGGLTPNERRNGWTKIPAPPVEEWHGTPQGVDRHRWRGEPSCDACRAARNERERIRAQERREASARVERERAEVEARSITHEPTFPCAGGCGRRTTLVYCAWCVAAEAADAVEPAWRIAAVANATRLPESGHVRHAVAS